MYTPDTLILNGNYRIERELGRGAFGIVYLAQHTMLNTQRAIKVLHTQSPEVGNTLLAECRRSFALEARLGVRLKHPHIVQVYDFEEWDGALHCIMEYAPNGSLAALRARAPLPADEVARLLDDACRGLHAIHSELDAVHRDISPGNLLLDANGRVLVADLGLAQVDDLSLLDGLPDQKSLFGSKAQPHPGSPGYRSPEHDDGGRLLSPAADIYGLGSVAFELLTGKRWERLQAQVRGPRAVRSEVPEWLDLVVTRMLAHDVPRTPADAANPLLRYASCAEVLQALTEQGTVAPEPAAGVAGTAPGQSAGPMHTDANLPKPPMPTPEPALDEGQLAAQRPYTQAVAALNTAEHERDEIAEAIRQDAARSLWNKLAQPARYTQTSLATAEQVVAARRAELAKLGGPTAVPLATTKQHSPQPAPAASDGEAANRYQSDTHRRVADYEAKTRTELESKATAERTAREEADREQDDAKPLLQAIFERTGIELLYVPAGPFRYGYEEARTTLDSFWIGKTPITNAQYARFVQLTDCDPPQHWESGRIPPGLENHPVVFVSWDDANDFCEWAGLRLPSEEEWEKAARGTDGRAYPWGNTKPNRWLCNFNNNVKGTTAVSSYPNGASPYGLLDMAGNVWEWCADPYNSHYYVRGGASHLPFREVRCAERDHFSSTDQSGSIGFRVAADGPLSL